MRTPDAGTRVPPALALVALAAAVFGLPPADAAALRMHFPEHFPTATAAPAAKCQAEGTADPEAPAAALARSALQARYRPVYWNSFQVPDSLIAARLDALVERSPTFAAAIGRMRDTRFFTLIATARQADLILGLDCLVGPVAAGVLGDTGYMAGRGDGDVVGAFVRIDLDAIRALATRRVAKSAAATRDTVPAAVVDSAVAAIVDDVLIHEVWGHVVPVADLRHESARCADPRPHQDPLTSCVVRRENRLRAELGLLPTAQYGIVDADNPSLPTRPGQAP